MNRKGGLFDSFTFIGVVVMLILVIGAVIFVMGIVTNNLVSIDHVTENVNVSEAAEDTIGKLNTGLGGLRLTATIIIIAMALSILMSNFLIRAHPAWAFVYLIVTVLAVIVAAPVSNFYEKLLQQNIFNGGLGDMESASFLLLNLPTIVTVIGIFGAILLFINISRDSGLGGSPL